MIVSFSIVKLFFLHLKLISICGEMLWVMQIFHSVKLLPARSSIHWCFRLPNDEFSCPLSFFLHFLVGTALQTKGFFLDIHLFIRSFKSAWTHWFSCYSMSCVCCHYLFYYFLILIFYCYSIIVVWLFSPSLHPTPAKPPAVIIYFDVQIISYLASAYPFNVAPVSSWHALSFLKMLQVHIALYISFFQEP